MYGSIFIQICAVGSKRRIFLYQRAFWPFKVVQGHPRSMILYQSKARIRLSRSLSWSYLAPFLRYGDLLAKKLPIYATFLLPLSHSAPSLPSLCSLWNFALKLTMRKLESWDYPQRRPHDRSWSRFGMIPACDGRTVRRSDRRSVRQSLSWLIQRSPLCIASYADGV